ncbi:MAG: Small GTP-binding protein [Candidatus Angelobacter sp.]|jgi:GTP-binding protein|nr:Small GTP-binding protein [Candidatus Angelobacter sp.]
MKVISNFVTSAAAPHQFPSGTVPEVAFLGRSNVGKSSLLNSLVGTKMANVSNTPGRTQTINFFTVNFGASKPNPDLMLADLPGYGYARVPKAIVGEWPKFIEPYLAEREPLRLCICLIDSNIPPQKSDLQLLHWLQTSGRPFELVGTKTDKLSGNKLKQSMIALSREFGSELLPYSVKTGVGKDELWRKIREAVATL